jgi:AcrR family transcriptional regulator
MEVLTSMVPPVNPRSGGHPPPGGKPRPGRAEGPGGAVRAYDNAARAAQSEATRQRIVAVAREHFSQVGYRAATVAAIARSAGVHVDTVYQLVGRKPQLLRELIEQAIPGTAAAVPAEARDYVVAIRAEPRARAKLALYAGAMRRINERMAPLFLALRDASATEPEAREVWQEVSARRAANMRLLAEELQATGELRSELTVEETADVIWSTNSAEFYSLLVTERGWTPERYERWLADAWARLLLRTPGP